MTIYDVNVCLTIALLMAAIAVLALWSSPMASLGLARHLRARGVALRASRKAYSTVREAELSLCSESFAGEHGSGPGDEMSAREAKALKNWAVNGQEASAVSQDPNRVREAIGRLASGDAFPG